MKVFTPDGRAVRHRRRISTGAPQRGDQCARHARRALRDRRRRDRRHVAGRRHRHHRRRDARRAGHAVAAIGHGAARCRHAAAEHRRRRRAGPGRLARQPLSPRASSRSERHACQRLQPRAPLVEMRDISIAFGGIHAVDDVSRRPSSRRGRRPARPQRRRQVDADQDPVRRLQARRRRDLRRRRAGRHPQPARRQALRHRDDLPDPRARRQPRRRRQPLPRPRAAHAAGARSTTSPWRPRRAR